MGSVNLFPLYIIFRSGRKKILSLISIDLGKIESKNFINFLNC